MEKIKNIPIEELEKISKNKKDTEYYRYELIYNIRYGNFEYLKYDGYEYYTESANIDPNDYIEEVFTQEYQNDDINELKEKYNKLSAKELLEIIESKNEILKEMDKEGMKLSKSGLIKEIHYKNKLLNSLNDY